MTGTGKHRPRGEHVMVMSRVGVPTRRGSLARDVTPSPAMLGASIIVALGILVAATYALVAPEPYRSLPGATVLAARGQDVVSVLVAALLLALVLRARLLPLRLLFWIGLLAYVVYSYGIYVIGVPMNRVF